MALISYTDAQLRELARLMRAEAEEDGEQGMLLVGNVGVNRVITDCLDFEEIRSLPDMIYQSPGGFEAIQESYFYQRAREKEIRLARRAVQGDRIHPGRFSLWFFRPPGDCPPEWFGQPYAGDFGAHCFYEPFPGECPEIH
ncbi:cell wall hydrolase [Alkalibacillus haloalkaliphilus]|uniref:cell wall hydrolase n=1 Tax=Alkalibacillus haloalkaliphilus TaxID=94136 RepID=UPI002936AB7E|nr:cell wall hydrolase [Alkalibacillus haloalkaliphilus]MDV2583009.1 cell wall hydrolase [Alkalibacillus haloalkaliphilus]